MSLFAEHQHTRKTIDEDDELHELESLIADLDELMVMASKSNQETRSLKDLMAYKQQILFGKGDSHRNKEPELGLVQAGPKKESESDNKTL